MRQFCMQNFYPVAIFDIIYAASVYTSAKDKLQNLFHLDAIFSHTCWWLFSLQSQHLGYEFGNETSLGSYKRSSSLVPSPLGEKWSGE